MLFGLVGGLLGLAGADATACGRLEPSPLIWVEFELGLTKWVWIGGVSR